MGTDYVKNSHCSIIYNSDQREGILHCNHEGIVNYIMIHSCTMENCISYKIYLRVTIIHMENFYHTMLWSKLDQIYTRAIDTEVKGDTDLQKKVAKCHYH